ncbi:HNH endonuclease [Rhodococcus aetherivorans]
MTATKYKKGRIPSAVRREVCRRYGAVPGTTVPAQCAYCSASGTIAWHLNSPSWPVVDGLEFDHVTAEYKGGTSTASNLVLACRSCNRSKGCK